MVTRNVPHNFSADIKESALFSSAEAEEAHNATDYVSSIGEF